MLDPRIEGLAKRIEKLEKAIEVLANYFDGIAWRVATNEEKFYGIKIAEEIKEILEQKE